MYLSTDTRGKKKKARQIINKKNLKQDRMCFFFSGCRMGDVIMIVRDDSSFSVNLLTI